MKQEELAAYLADKTRIGMDEELAEAIGLADATVTRGRLLAAQEGDRGHLQVLFLGCFVVDDTDFWGDGEIYWWSVPVMLDREGKPMKSPLHGLPNAMPPHKCGDQEWMTNLSLARPPVWAVIPPGSEVDRCVIRVGIYDDDRDPADMSAAMREGLVAWSKLGEMKTGDTFIHPVRDAIYDGLKAADDDILIDQDLIIRRGEHTQFNAGMVGSIINAMARAYYFVFDTEHTKQFGPITLHKGQMEKITFDVPIETGGRIAIFARGHDVSCPFLGELTVDSPFVNRVVTSRQEKDLAHGITITGSGPAKVVAYYTPSYSD